MIPIGRGRPRRRASGESGFALIIVLWTMVLLALLVTHIEQTGRGEAQLALNLRRAAALQAQADGAISVAAFHLLDPSNAGWRPDGEPYVTGVENDQFTRRIVVRINDQAGEIDLNTASAPLLTALVTTLGVAPAQAALIGANIAAWRFPGVNTAAANGGTAAYRAAGRDYGPPGAPYESAGELSLVLGVTPALQDLLNPHVTIFHQGSPDLTYADPVVTRAVTAAGVIAAVPAPKKNGAGLHVVTVSATAYGDAGTAFTRQAVLMVGQQADGLVHILSWTTPAR